MSSAKDRVLITGAGGMLGNAIYPYFSSRFQHVTATDKDTNESWISHLDVRDSAQLRLTFERLKPSLVLHLAACTDALRLDARLLRAAHPIGSPRQA